jgi:hypothetical protein
MTAPREAAHGLAPEPTPIIQKLEERERKRQDRVVLLRTTAIAFWSPLISPLSQFSQAGYFPLQWSPPLLLPSEILHVHLACIQIP